MLTLLAGPVLFEGAHGLAAQTLEDALVAAYLTNPNLEAQRAALGRRTSRAAGPGWLAADAWSVDSGVAYNDVDSSVGAIPSPPPRTR